MHITIDRRKLFKTQAYSIILIFILNTIAVKFDFYSSIWYFDMIMHFLGGFWLGLAFLWLFSYKNSSLELFFALIFKIILSVLIIGVLWEIFEIIFINIIAKNPFNTLDSLSDIFFDLSGSSFVIIFFLKKFVCVT
ncbi:MAG: hypothetical protein WCP17_00775 [bacterium]